MPAASLLELSSRILDGTEEITDHHPFRPSNTLEEVGDGVAFVESFANVTALATPDGLCLVDTGSALVAGAVHEAVRSWSSERATTAVYTHGHIDHVFGTAAFEAEGPMRVVGHAGIDPRFDRYVKSAGYNAVINQRQFRAPGLQWPLEYRRPDVTYTDRLDLDLGGVAAELHHARGETDDHTWVWVPERRTLCTGDLIIWCTPNAGNPQKVQRYAEDWAVALREMAALEPAPELLLPGHGLPIAGADRVRAVLLDSATLLDSLATQTLALMNEGARLDDIIHTVAAPRNYSRSPTFVRSTTTRSSSCGMYGASTAAGTTATLPSSSRHARRPWRRSSLDSRAAPTCSRAGRSSWPRPVRTATSGWPATWRNTPPSPPPIRPPPIGREPRCSPSVATPSRR